MTEPFDLRFRDPTRARALAEVLDRLTKGLGRSPVSLMHVCGSHEQAIAKFGLRAAFPPSSTSSRGRAARSA